MLIEFLINYITGTYPKGCMYVINATTENALILNIYF